MQHHVETRLAELRTSRHIQIWGGGGGGGPVDEKTINIGRSGIKKGNKERPSGEKALIEPPPRHNISARAIACPTLLLWPLSILGSS